MATDWKSKPLGELVEDIIDRRGVTPLKLGSDFTSAGHRVISAKLIKNRQVDLAADEPRYIDEATFAKWMKTPLRRDDVVLTSEAPLGEPAYLANDEDWALGQRLFAIRTDKSQLHGRFLYYALQADPVRTELLSRATGTTVTGVRQSELRRVSVPHPPIDEQRRIAHILGTLDDKIELNRRMNETLEEMARALFKSWFVDFDPVRAKAEGRDPGLPKHLADLFPDRLVDSELGPIPEGWRAGNLGDIAEQVRRGVQPEEIPKGTPYVALEHMPRRSISLANWNFADAVGSGKSEFRKGEVLFGRLRPYFHKVVVAPVDGVCSTDIVVLRAKVAPWDGFVLHLVSSDSFIEFTTARSAGTRMPRTSWRDMATYGAAVPGVDVAAAFDVVVGPMAERMSASSRLATTLIGLRESLLRDLM